MQQQLRILLPMKFLELVTQQAAQQAQLKEEMLKAGVNLLQIEIGADCVDALTNYFHQRQRRETDETGG